MEQKVIVLGTGGTIASTVAEGGATPTESVEKLTETLPVGDQFELQVKQVSQRPSSQIDFDVAFELAAHVREVAAAVSGVVILHGTDTMEETGYLLDVVLDVSVPVVLTGSQRLADDLGADGPRNVFDAVRAATAESLRGSGGVYLLLNEEFHAARDVTKTHTSKLESFQSPDAGPIGTLSSGSVLLRREPGTRSVHVPVDRVTTNVAMVKTGLGVDGTLIRSAIEDDVDGIVVEGLGKGNVPQGVANAIREALERDVPVVMTSRCQRGTVSDAYGDSGGLGTLHKDGVILGDDLPAHKARLKLLLATSYTDEYESIRAFFETANPRRET